MAKPKAEQSVLWLGIFASLTFLVALVFTALFPAMNLNWDPKTADAKELFHKSVDGMGYTPAELHGRLVYQREGCMYCHTQQIRPLKSEMKRYGINGVPAPAADEREYIERVMELVIDLLVVTPLAAGIMAHLEYNIHFMFV